MYLVSASRSVWTHGCTGDSAATVRPLPPQVPAWLRCGGGEDTEPETYQHVLKCGAWHWEL